METKKRALLIFPGLLKPRLLNAMTSQQGINVFTDIKDFPIIIKGSKLITPSTCYHFTHYQDEVDDVINEYFNSDANFFIVPWSHEMVNGLNKNAIETVLIKPNQNTQYRFVGKAYLDGASMDTVNLLRQEWSRWISLPVKYESCRLKVSYPLSISALCNTMTYAVHQLPD